MVVGHIDLINMENRLDSIALQKESASKTSSELDYRDDEIKKETIYLKELKKSLDLKIISEENDLKSFSGDIAKERSVLDLKQQTVSGTFKSMEKIQEKIIIVKKELYLLITLMNMELEILLMVVIQKVL